MDGNLNTKEVICPSGLTVTIKQLKLSQLDSLMSAKVKDKDGAIARGCVDKILDYGPYPEGEELVWLNVFSSDRFYVMMMARAFTFGGNFDFNARCEYCGKTNELSVDLEELEFVEADKELMRKSLRGEKLTTTMFGKEITYVITTGKLERQIQQLVKKSNKAPLTAYLLTHIIAVEGEESPKKWLYDLSFAEAQEVSYMLDDAVGGIDTDAEFECNYCSEDCTETMPLGNEDFWKRKKVKRAKKAKK